LMKVSINETSFIIVQEPLSWGKVGIWKEYVVN
jgi:hypothetical protein